MPTAKAGATSPASTIPVGERFETIERMKEAHPCLDISYMCERMGVSRSGYYAHVAAGRKYIGIDEMKDRDAVRWAYSFRNRPKGARQIKMTLQHEKSIVMNLKKIRRIMKDIGIACPVRKANPMRRIAKAIRTHSIFPNKLNRQFATSRPGQHMLTDITYIFYGANGRAYLSTVKDASTNKIVCWTMSERLDLSFLMEMLGRLESVEWLPERFLLHSDQGCHYTSVPYQRQLSAIGAIQSMSRKGNCWDNAPMESFFGHMKDELHLKGCLTYEQAKNEISDYMDYYNNHRCQWGLKRMTPVEYREWLLGQPSCEIMVIPDKKFLLGHVQEGII